MNFIKESADKNPIVDTVFAIVRKANAAKEEFGAENIIDATLGSLYDEEGNLVAMKSVFDSFAEVTPKQKAGYAAGFLGNADYRTLCTQWTVGGTNLAKICDEKLKPYYQDMLCQLMRISKEYQQAIINGDGKDTEK